MLVNLDDKKRLTAAVTGVVVASIALIAAVAVIAFSVTGGDDDNANEVEATGSDVGADLSPADLTRPTAESPYSPDSIGSAANSSDLALKQSEDVLQISPDDAITTGETSNAIAEESTDLPSNTDDVVTGESDQQTSQDTASTTVGSSEQADRIEANQEAEKTTTTSTQATPDPQAPTNSKAPGVNRKELFVDGQNGNGHNPGTKDRPFRRPIEATLVAEPGTTIYLRGGTYDTNTHGTFSIRRSGTPENWIRIAAYPGERVELVNGGEFGNGFEVLGASYVEVADFVLRGRGDSLHGSGVFVKDGAHDVRIINNNIRGFGGAGISVVKSANVTIERNEVRDNAHRSHFQGSGISIYEPSGPTGGINGNSFVIRGNYVVHNYNAVRGKDGRITDGNCVILDRFVPVGYQGKTLIENNVCVENGGRGIHLFKAGNALIRNNTLVRNVWSPEVKAGRGELTAGHGANTTFINNLVFNNAGASYINADNQNTWFKNNWVASGPPPGEGNQQLTGDISKFFRSTDREGPVDQYRPLPGSGLAGSANGSSVASHDLTGRQRPGNAAIGAFEP